MGLDFLGNQNRKLDLYSGHLLYSYPEEFNTMSGADVRNEIILSIFNDFSEFN